MVSKAYRDLVLPEGADSAPFPRLRRYLGSLDWMQLAALAFLIGAGLLFIRSTGIQVGTPSALGFFGKQLRWVAAGCVLWFLCSTLNLKSEWVKLGGVLYCLASLALLVAVFFIGLRVNGTLGWIPLPGVGARLQPAEGAKLAVILTLSAMFSSPLFHVNRWTGITAAFLVTGIPFLLILKQPDFGSAVVLLPVLAGLIFAAGIKWRYLLFALATAAVLGTLFAVNEIYEIHPLLKEYQRDRIRVFLDPESDLMNSGYNAYQARLAVGAGGFSGKGIGEGTQNRLGFLPQTVSNNDFIFSVIAEETGFFGCTLLLFAYALLLSSMLRTAYRCSGFGRYFGVGAACLFFTHVFINVGMSAGVTPVTGVPLPFVSYGGSFLLMGMATLGILQSLYRNEPEHGEG